MIIFWNLPWYLILGCVILSTIILLILWYLIPRESQSVEPQ